MRLARREMRVQASVNKLFDWLMQKPEAERKIMIRKAVENAGNEESLARERSHDLQDAFWENMQKKRAEEVALKIGLDRKQQEAQKIVDKYDQK